MANVTVSVTGLQAIVNPSSWGKNALWGQGAWNTGGDVDQNILQGWGHTAWNQANWGDADTYDQGWGRLSWGASYWGTDGNVTQELTGFQITSSFNASVTIAIDVTTIPTGISFSSTLGTPTVVGSVSLETANFLINSTQGYITPKVDVDVIPTGISFGSAVGVIDPADQVMGLIGLETTVAQGTAFAPNEDVSVTGSQITSEMGTPVFINEVAIQLTGFGLSTTLGSVTVPNDAAALTGFELETSLGTILGTGSVAVPITGIAVTSTLGTIPEIPDQIVGFSGLSSSTSIGSIDLPDQAVGITGLSMSLTFNPATTNVWMDVDTGTTRSYSNVDTGTDRSYSNVSKGTTRSYTDVAA